MFFKSPKIVPNRHAASSGPRLRRLGLAMVCLGMLAASLGAAKPVAVTAAGRVTYVAGIVNVKKSQTIGPGFRLRTGNNGRVELTFANGHRMRVGPSSDLLLVAYKPQQKQTLVKLDKGRVYNNVKPGQGSRVIVRTRYSTATVLGTIYDTALGGLSSKTTVVHGSVGVRLPENDAIESIFDKLPELPKPTPTPASDGGFTAPTVVENPVHEIQLPLRVVPGPYEVSRDQWLQIVENQQISMGEDGKAQITQIDQAQLQKIDEWFRWNRQMDAQAQ